MILGVHFQGLINQTQIYLILRKQVNRGGGSVNPHRVINVGDFKCIIIGNTEDFINQIIINMINNRRKKKLSLMKSIYCLIKEWWCREWYAGFIGRTTLLVPVAIYWSEEELCYWQVRKWITITVNTFQPSTNPDSHLSKYGCLAH